MNLGALLFGARGGKAHESPRWAQTLWAWKWALLIVLVFFFGAGLARDFHLFGKSRAQLAVEARLAQAETAALALQVQLNAQAAQISQETALRRAQIRSLSEAGHDDIAAATPEDEVPLDPKLVAAWRRSLERLSIAAADPNADHADPGGRNP